MNDSAREPGLWRWLPFLAITLIYLLELRIDVIDVDSAQYAHIAEEMFRTKSYLIIHNRGADYLDKPPLTFWLAAASFHLFGVSTWAYKLPSVLSALLAVFSTYRLTRLLHSERVAWLAALMLSSTFAMFMWTNDVRTDTVLLGAAMFATWQLAESLITGSAPAFWFGWAGIAFALMAKGPIGAFVPLVAVGAEAIRSRRWNWLLNPRWLGGIAFCLALLGPMLFGLYEQFGWRGVTFFFWTQSFGRITGESNWRDTTSPFFFTHTILWELLPWTPLFLAGLAHDLVRAARARAPEILSLAGFLIPFVALSLSHYKLPHYVFITAPFACVIAAAQVERVSRGIALFLSLVLQGLVVLLIGGLGYLFCAVVFPIPSVALIAVLAIMALAALVLFLPRFTPEVRLVGPSLLTMIGFAAMLALHFYPRLLTYQASSMAAHRLWAEHVPADHVRTFGPTSYALDFLLQTSVPNFDPARSEKGDVWIFTDDHGRQELASLGRPMAVIAELDDFPISHWSMPFFRPSTRARQLQRRYLIRLSSS